jgi:branched-subunit amino acid transport protein AzlD
MTTATIRAILALLIVGVITAFMALYPLLMPQQVQLNDYADFFAKTSSVYTGIIGVIVGYYFGRSTTAKPQGETTDQQQGPKS